MELKNKLAGLVSVVMGFAIMFVGAGAASDFMGSVTPYIDLGILIIVIILPLQVLLERAFGFNLLGFLMRRG